MNPIPIVASAICLVLLIILFAACSKVESMLPTVRTVEVKVPVVEEKEIPTGLMRTPYSPLPEYVPPSSPQASSCLTKQGEIDQRVLATDREGRLDTWEKNFAPSIMRSNY